MRQWLFFFQGSAISLLIGMVALVCNAQNADLVLDDISCKNDTLTYTFTVDPPVANPQWGFSPNLSQIGTPDGNGIVLLGVTVGSETLTLDYTDANGLPQTASFSDFRASFFTVDILGDNIEVGCDVQEFGLQGLVDAPFPQTPYRFIWRDTLTNDSVGLQASNTYRANTANDNLIFLTVLDENDCTARDSAVLLAPKRVPENFALSDTTICEGDAILVSLPQELINDPEVVVRWADGTPTNTRSISAAAAYAIEVTTECGTGEASFELSYLPPLLPLDGPIDMTFCPLNPQSTRLPTQTIAQVLSWQWPDGSNDTLFTPTAVGTYSVQLVGQCETQTRLFTVVDTAQRFDIPNAFSPNGDLLNDVFVVGGGVALEYLHIYTRWGSRIASPVPPERGWDGEAYPAGIYIFELEFEPNGCINQLERHRSGSVTLIR